MNLRFTLAISVFGLLSGSLIACRIFPPSASASSVVLKGTTLAGSQFSAQDEQGQFHNFQIRSVELDPQDVDHDTYLYTVLVQDAQQQWQNLCEPDHEGVSKAIPLQGSWDAQGRYSPANTITFGCTSGALGKCVRMGYKPWKIVDGQPLRDIHQACIRMVRADYCGDGKGHTRNGTPIDVYNRLDLQNPTPDSGMEPEAAWTPDGAAYLNHSRWGQPVAEILAECPRRLAGHTTQAQLLNRVQMQQQHPEALLFNDSLIRPQSPAS